ncbi:hypothetical protein [Sphingobacterium bambusae]|uniref:Lipoprotein n=1 Tax=Sphingobacterium bambusae TaxID=662858 RepID=A0ABW6BB50_9SPHI|nr:hypothetical protein [Sphingobacterium bambusae]WPL48791.1 hypothetical protein SCB77_22835 [Sphingobacterium bambusae]
MRFLKIISKALITATAISATFLACQKDTFNPSAEEDLGGKISFKSGTKSTFSQGALKTGIYQIDAKQDGRKISYTTKIANTSILNGNKIDFSTFQLELVDNKLVLDGEYAIYLKDDELYLETPLYSGFMKDGRDNKVIDTKTAALMLFYGEIALSSENVEKQSYAQFLNHFDTKIVAQGKMAVSRENKALFNNRQCGINHAVEFGWSASSTAADLQQQLNNTSFYNGCTKVGGIDTSCMTDSHACMSSQTYNCPC